MRGCAIVLLLVLGYSLSAQVRERLLHANWEFRKQGEVAWEKARVPGSVHTDLWRNKRIADPFYGEQEKNLQWIEKETWEYRCQFTCKAQELRDNHQELLFQGLDTYATVYLNDSLILETNNMFREWSRDVASLLRIGTNTLKLVFRSAVKEGRTRAQSLPYTLPEGERVFTRKAQYHYGWDWGPRFVTCGIWRPVKLRSWSNLNLKTVCYWTDKLSEDTALVKTAIELQSAGDKKLTLTVTNKETGAKLFEKEMPCGASVCRDTLAFPIVHPRLWWSKGMGEPYRYHLVLSISEAKQELIRHEQKLGLRRVEWVNQADSIGSSFFLKLNGKAVYAKGANLVPPHSFITEYQEQDYRELVMDAAAHNMNMLRVWGGGLYLDEAFYEACDEGGILVWQDFMFACAMYPGDPAFLENAREEVRQQFGRLRKHCSIVLWCGNNESREGWFNWAWQKQYHYTAEDSINIWQQYLDLFQKVIPEAMHLSRHEKSKPDAPFYLESSPGIGWGHESSLRHGDSHYWGVWWANEVFETYRKKVPRFASEFGFQSLPEFASLANTCPASELVLGSSCLAAHQKHPKGYATIETYMKRAYRVNTELRTYAYLSQLLQRDGVLMAVHAQRFSKGRCMGTLIWQWNDCWPVSSWSAVDFYGRHKALAYALKKAYASLSMDWRPDQSPSILHILNDSAAQREMSLLVQLLDFYGKEIWRSEQQLSLPAATQSAVLLSTQNWPAIDSAAVYLRAELRESGQKSLVERFYFVPPKSLKLPPSELRLERMGNGSLRVHSQNFSKDVYLYNSGGDLELSENYLDLDAGEAAYIFPRKPKGISPGPIYSMCLNNCYLQKNQAKPNE